MFNPQLNVPALQQVYAQHGAISIQNILVPEYAEAIHKELLNLPWEIEIKDYAQADSFRMPAADLADGCSVMDVLQSGNHGKDLNNLFYIRKCVNSENFSPGVLKEYVGALNADPFLELMRQITGHDDVTHSWVEATNYEKCCFLGAHRDDHHPGNKVAFVFNLTKQWKLDWGGLLMLQPSQSQPPIIVPPVWNSLSMFTVPINHTVSCVSPAATQGRYSLTGWLR